MQEPCTVGSSDSDQKRDYRRLDLLSPSRTPVQAGGLCRRAKDRPGEARYEIQHCRFP